jgi:hypothetical protein
MAFDVNGAKEAGYSDGEIVNFLAPEKKFDVKAARESGYNDSEILSFLSDKEEKPTEKESALRQVADVPVNFAKGISQGVRMLSDAFGADNAVSANLRGVEDYLGGLLSAQAKNDQQAIATIFKDAEDKGVLDQVKAGLKAFTVAPVDIMSQAFGTVIPTLAGGLAGAALKIGARAAAVGTGAAMGTGSGKSSIYDAVTEELKQAGLPPEAIQQAATQAQEYGGKNLDLILANTLLGGVAAGTGIERALIPGMVKNISANVAKRGALGRGLTAGVPEFLTEGAQGGTEQLSQNVALQREGFDVPTFRGVGTAATLEAVAGGVLGGGIGAMSRQQPEFAPPRQPDAGLNAIPEQDFTAPAIEPPAPPMAPPAPPMSQEEIDRQASYEQQIAKQNAFQASNFPVAAPATETAQQAYERQMAEQAQRPAVRPFGVTDQQPLLNEQQLVARRQQAQVQAEQQFGLGVGEARAPIDEQERINRQLAAQQEMDADRFKQQTALPEITPAQAQIRTPAPAPTAEVARGFDRQAEMLGQMEGLSPAGRVALSDQADAVGGTGQRVRPQTRFVELNPLTPLQARQRLAVLQDETPDGDFFITPHPQVGGRFAIEQRADRQIAQQNQEAFDLVQRQEQVEAGDQAQERVKLERQAQQQQEQAYAQKQADIREAFVNAPPSPQSIIQAFAVPAFARNAEQVAAIKYGTERLNPSDLSVLEMAGQNPGSMKNAVERIEREHRVRYSMSGNATPELKATVDDMRKKLLPILKRFGLGNLGLRIVDSIENGTADGMYAQQVITLALDSDNPLGVMRHEVIHALKELGAFTPAEWKVLTKAAKDTWINQFFNREMQDRYQAVYLEQNGNLDNFQEYLQEEAIAQAFRFFSDTTPRLKEFQRPSGMISNLMRRLNEMFKAIRDFFASKDLPVDEMFLPNRIFADIERGAIQPGREQGRVEELPNEWKATPADEEQAVDYALENGILPYLSDGQMQVSVPQAKFSLKPAYTEKQIAQNKGNNHPLFGLPINKNGTITLYLPTNNAEARRVVREKKLQGNTPAANRIYLTNESNGAKVMQNPGNIDHTMDGANVMIQVNPDFLQLDQEYADGRKDFFIPIAEGEAFAKKMAQTKLFTLDAPRDRAISKETTLGEIEAKIQESIASYKAMPVAERRKKLAEARKVLKTEHNVGTLLSENGKLQKTRVGDYGIKFEGNSVASMGLGLASAQKITEKLTTCVRSARCENLCLGETSGQNLLYGGEGQFKSGPRLSQYLKTEAMVMHPEEFAIALYNEIDAFRRWSAKETGTETTTNEAGEKVKVDKQAYQPAIRLNVTSDFAPKVFDSIIQSFPDVEFYDYTKLNTKSIAPNHHLTYSSDGVAQEVNGKTVGVGSNWKEMTKKLDNGFNVAMAFTSRKAMPEFLLDEATGKKYQVWNGDNYDARFLDPKPGESGNKLNQGMIIGLTNKDRTGKPEDAAIKNDGFFVDYDPARDGKTLTIKDQSKFATEKPIAMPSKKFSLRAPTTQEFKRFFKDSKVVDKDGNPLVVYHGTNQDINEFTTQPNSLRSKFYAGEIGSWFGDDPKVANNFARGVSSPRAKGAVYPAFLNIKNPKTYNSYEEFMSDAKGRRSAPALRKDLIKQGFDGIHIKDSDTDFGGRRDDWVAFYPTQIKSATGNRGTFDATNPDIRFSLRAPKTPQFKRFFGNSKVVNADGTPKVMYHGTARIIDEFLPKQANAIFVTDNPVFAETFADDSVQFMVKEQVDLLNKKFEAMSPEDKVKFLKKAYKLGVKKGYISKRAADSFVDKIDDYLAAGEAPSQDDFKEVSEFFEDEIKNKLESGQNIMPLYVRAENPFDFQNPKHIKELREVYGDPDTIDDVKKGDWRTIESPDVQEAIQYAGFDGFYVIEGGNKNLAVYNPNQIKSAIGNRGTYDETGRILYSLKNAPPNQYTKLTEDPITEKTINGVIKSAFNAVSNDGTSYRNALVDKFSQLSKTLSSLPLFNNKGELRGDMLLHSYAQATNLIKAGLVSGTPKLNKDGTIGIERSDNNLANAERLADLLDTNKNVIESGLTGRGYIANIARNLRGADIIAEDRAAQQLGAQQLAKANQMYVDLNADIKTGKLSAAAIAKRQKEINKLRKEGKENSRQKRELQVKPEDIAWAEKQLQMTPEVQAILDIWKEVNTSLVNLYESTGMIDKETADKYRGQKNYVPLFKSREDLNEEAFFRTGTSPKTASKLKELKGADITRNIWENITKQYAVMTAAAYENQTRRVSVEQMRSINPDLAQITTKDDPRVNLRFRKDGEDVHAIIENPNDLAAFQSMTYQFGPVMQFFGGFTKLLRAGALLNPMFWLRQLIRDPISVSLTGQAGIVTPFHSAKEFISILTRNSEEARVLASRGVIGQFDTTVSLNEFLGSVGKNKQTAPGFIQNSIQKLMEIHEASDAATRVAVYKKAKAKALKDGMSEAQAVDYAVFKARESINFALTGNSPALAAARQLIPFLNATIVGLDTLYRAATGYGLNPEEKAAARSAFRNRAMMMVMMSVAYAALMGSDDDYNEQPDYVKDGNWLFPIMIDGQKKFIRIPVPYEVGYLFKTLPEAAYRYLWSGTSTGKEVAKSIGKGFMQNLPTGGTPIPQFAKPALEAITNHSFFTWNPIESVGDDRLPVAQRGRKASEVSKLLSEAGLDKIGLSPAKIDTLTKGYFAEFGNFFNELADAVLAVGSGKERTAKDLEDMPFFKSFMADPQADKAVSTFYDHQKTATEVANLFSKMKNEGRAEELQKLIADPEKRQMIVAAPAMKKISDVMSTINKQIGIIDRDQSKSPAERRQLINELEQRRNEVANRGVEIARQLGL